MNMFNTQLYLYVSLHLYLCLLMCAPKYMFTSTTTTINIRKRRDEEETYRSAVRTRHPRQVGQLYKMFPASLVPLPSFSSCASHDLRCLHFVNTRSVRRVLLVSTRFSTMSVALSSSEELQSAISKLKAGKSPDGNGIRAEDIKDCNDETKETMRQIFNEVIKRNEFTPEEWKKVKIKVIYKKGDVEDVSNYRPICSLPSMYKLFSTILCGRFFQCLTKIKQKIRRASEKLTKQRIILRRTECWNKNVRSGESKCGQRRWTS